VSVCVFVVRECVCVCGEGVCRLYSLTWDRPPSHTLPYAVICSVGGGKSLLFKSARPITLLPAVLFLFVHSRPGSYPLSQSGWRSSVREYLRFGTHMLAFEIVCGDSTWALQGLEGADRVQVAALMLQEWNEHLGQ
jgi:hypothetical protein